MTEFDAWAKTVLVEDESDPTGIWPDGMLQLVERIFSERGPVSSVEFRSLVQKQQLEHAQTAVAAIGNDLARTTDLPRPPFEYRIDEPWGPRVAYRGQYATTPLMEVSPARIICEVVDFMQDEVVKDMWSGWPMCPDHTGMVRPVVIDQIAVWFCRPGDHVVSQIGSLAL